MTRRYLYKDTFAVIGKVGQGSANNPQEWIPPLWNSANANFLEIADRIRKTENGMPLGVWGAMNDAHESNRRWGEIGKYMAGCEAEIDALPPAGWTKWVIPAQTYMVVACSMNEYGVVLGKINNDPEIQIIGTVHERYPEPDNSNIVELYIPIAAGRRYCQSCDMPMTGPEDFGTKKDGSFSQNYCHNCYKSGALRHDITMDMLITDVQNLVDIEAAHPDLLSTRLLECIQTWLRLDEAAKRTSIPSLHSELIDGQDCDFMGTQWEKEWLADGRVCHCIACNAARKCISDMKMLDTNNQ